MDTYAIAIDGPAGSGKSTVAKEIAKIFNIIYVDTGAMYRTVGLYCIENGIDTKDEKAVEKILNQIDMKIKLENNNQMIFLNGENVNTKIRSQEAGKAASDVAAILAVREKLVEIQRKLALENNVIMDGRDIGTNVLPNAQIKIYLIADAKIRAQRRLHELQLLGKKADLEIIKKQIEDRDKNDMTRIHNPLKKAEDAIELDTSDKNIDEVVKYICEIVRQKLKN